jgi:hypothetical protein
LSDAERHEPQDGDAVTQQIEHRRILAERAG